MAASFQGIETPLHFGCLMKDHVRKKSGMKQVSKLLDFMSICWDQHGTGCCECDECSCSAYAMFQVMMKMEDAQWKDE